GLALVLVSSAAAAQAGTSLLTCGDVKVRFWRSKNQHTLVLLNDEGLASHKWVFPMHQRYIRIRTPAIWLDTKGYKTTPDDKPYWMTLDGKPCEETGYED